MKLSELNTGESGVIAKVSGRGAFRKRITEMGFVKGKKVNVVKNAPLLDPVEYNIMGYEVSLRRNEAALIEVITEEEARKTALDGYNGVITEDILVESAKKIGKTINIVLVGNPNAGKTSVFNFASGSHEHVGNYSGVTVDYKEAQFKYKGYTINITDLPGTYSLSAYTPEEVYVRNYIASNNPDVIVNVVDASNLERNLYLTTQLIDMDLKVVVDLNMYDELERSGDRFDYKAMGELVGMPFVPTVGSKGRGLNELFDTIINVYTDHDKTYRHIHINYGHDVEAAICSLQKLLRLPENRHQLVSYSTRFLAIKLLDKDREARKLVEKLPNGAEVIAAADLEIKRLEKHLNDDSETIITDAKYAFVAGALKETFKEGGRNKRKNTEAIDAFLTHRLFGFPIFLFFIWLTFYATFALGEYPKGLLEAGIAWIMGVLDSAMPTGPFKDLLVNGIINGVGNVIVFLPNILILFFFISLLEDTGYMARAAFIMDKLMHKIGLHGKSFIPLIMGFGCNVPAVMATRTIESRSNRILTMLIAPLMSCSARLPVYILVLGAFFPESAGTMLFGIYLLGIVLAILMALLFKRTMFRHKDLPFVMELPPYRIPTLKATTRHMWFKGSQYLKKMGGIILVAVIFIWALSYYPRNVKYSQDFEAQQNKLSQSYGARLASLDTTSVEYRVALLERDSLLRHIDVEMQSERQMNSYLGRIGVMIEPAMRPLGFDWKMSVALLSALPAKEIVVSTMGVIYQVEEADESSTSSLIKKLQEDRYPSGERRGELVFTKPAALSFLVFVLVYFPCVAVVAALKKESGSWRWAFFTIGYTTALAWIVAFVVFNLAKLFA